MRLATSLWPSRAFDQLFRYPTAAFSHRPPPTRAPSSVFSVASFRTRRCSVRCSRRPSGHDLLFLTLPFGRPSVILPRASLWCAALGPRSSVPCSSVPSSSPPSPPPAWPSCPPPVSPPFAKSVTCVALYTHDGHVASATDHTIPNERATCTLRGPATRSSRAPIRPAIPCRIAGRARPAAPALFNRPCLAPARPSPLPPPPPFPL